MKISVTDYKAIRVLVVTYAAKTNPRYQSLIRFYIKGVLKESATLAIAINNIYTLLLENVSLDDFDEAKSNYYTYISTKIYYAILRQRRKLKMDKIDYVSTDVDTVVVENNTESQIAAKELQERIEGVIDPEIVALLIEGYTPEEIAEAKDMTVKQFYAYMDYRKKLLRGVLNNA